MTHTAKQPLNTTAAPSISEIEHNLRSDLAAAKALSNLLDAENQVLRTTTETINSELSQIVEQKQPHIETLEKNAIEREAWIRPRLTPSDSRASDLNLRQMNAWLDLLAETPELEALWQKIEQYVQICQRLNMINGRLIGFRKQRGQRLAEMLFGRPKTDTYSAAGYSESSRGSHSLVHA